MHLAISVFHLHHDFNWRVNCLRLKSGLELIFSWGGKMAYVQMHPAVVYLGDMVLWLALGCSALHLWFWCNYK